jgi:hypothetical protein
MLAGSRLKTRSTVGVAIGLLAVVATCAVPMASSSASDFAAPRAGAPSAAGVLVAQDDTKTNTWGRDGGISVPLPNGRTFWVFADSPQWQYVKGTWHLTGFIRGSTAGMQDYKSGVKPTAKFLEVNLGKKLAKSNKAAQFMQNPSLRLANGSGKPCTKQFGGSSTEAVRWATGAALLPDKTNVFIPYVDVCVSAATAYTVQGWGFTFYNWKKNKLVVPPTDVFKPKANGAAIPTTRWYGSPVVVGNKVTMFTSTCCGFPPGSVYTTTMPANLNALRNANSYVSTPIPNLATNLSVTVSSKSKTMPLYSMYQSSDQKGSYLILTAASPTGPWTGRAVGQLPKCASRTKSFPCTSFAIHPQFSTAHKLLVSYYLPGSGPNVPGHPFTQRPNFGHIVWASIPI